MSCKTKAPTFCVGAFVLLDIFDKPFFEEPPGKGGVAETRGRTRNSGHGLLLVGHVMQRNVQYVVSPCRNYFYHGLR
jgi:hypothetical protein